MNQFHPSADPAAPESVAAPARASSQNSAEPFHNVLHRMLAVDDKVSDLIFSPGRPPQVELTGDLQGVPIPGLELLKPAQIKAVADLMLAGNETGVESLD